MNNAVFWFSNDLRLEDNLSLYRAAQHQGQLAFIYCLDPALFKPNTFNSKSMGKHRYRFLLESLQDLDAQLRQLGQHLTVYYEPPLQVFKTLYNQHQIKTIYHSLNAGLNERRLFHKMTDLTDDVQLISSHTHTLYEPESLPFELDELPKTFSSFRRLIEKDTIIIKNPLAKPNQLPKNFLAVTNGLDSLPENDAGGDPSFNGGETAALQHTLNYFSHDYAQSYKETRNALDNWQHSTKLSPWLAVGNISPRQVFNYLRQHEINFSYNESTYWIFFELLWREYFQWYAHCHQVKLFKGTGINNNKQLNNFSGERFKRWCYGNTPYPLVNACMKQLNATGYMSNRGRQIVASCLIHELELDWRYGAAYFEQQLIDYDVASNWGNWQYLAGVGADPRGSRRFNIEKQTSIYDPKHHFIKAWSGDTQSLMIDSIDYNGWPK